MSEVPALEPIRASELLNKLETMTEGVHLTKFHNKHTEHVFRELQAELGENIVTADEHQRLLHGKDLSYEPLHAPDLVAYPRSTDDVVKIVRLCNKYLYPIVPYGLGSSLEGHVTALKGGVSLDMKHMNRILEINPQDFDAYVQAGVQRKQLNDALIPHGLFFAQDPGADATFGGMIGTSASGSMAHHYGTIKQNVLSLVAVLADGSVVRTGARARKSSAGYDLTHLFIGSEGTLGIVTEVRCRLFRTPERIMGSVCAFDNISQAAQAVIHMVQQGVDLARCELMDDICMRAVNLKLNENFLEKPTLFLEFHGITEAVSAHESRAQKIAEQNGSNYWHAAKSQRETSNLWRARYHAWFAVPDLRSNTQAFSTDVCVPISKLAEAIEGSKRDAADLQIPGGVPCIGHVADGNFHAFVLVDTSKKEEVERAEEFKRRVVRRAQQMGGTCTGEHGIGMGKIEFLQEEVGEAAIRTMCKIKKVMDPNNIMNPGKVLPANLVSGGGNL